MATNKVRHIEDVILSNEWASLTRFDYDYKFNNGEWKRVSRESYDRGDGAAILLYNPKKQTVILTRQFRMPIYANHKEEAMSVEVCAGAIDKNETAESTIIREAEEEVGIKVKKVTKVLEAYTSPGAVTEKMFLFTAEYNDAMKIHAGGGLEAENEEIEVLEIPFYKVITMMENGEIQDAKTIMLLQYAMINKLI